MTSGEVQAAVHEEQLNRHESDLKKSSDRIDSVEQAQIQYSIDRVGDKAQFKEMSTNLQSLKKTIEAAAQGFEKVEKRISDRLDLIDTTVTQTQKQVASINDRLSTIERERFDIVKFLRWCSSLRGTFFMIAVAAMLIGAIFPDAREWIGGLIGFVARGRL